MIHLVACVSCVRFWVQVSAPHRSTVGSTGRVPCVVRQNCLVPILFLSVSPYLLPLTLIKSEEIAECPYTGVLLCLSGSPVTHCPFLQCQMKGICVLNSETLHLMFINLTLLTPAWADSFRNARNSAQQRIPQLKPHSIHKSQESSSPSGSYNFHLLDSIHSLLSPKFSIHFSLCQAHCRQELEKLSSCVWQLLSATTWKAQRKEHSLNYFLGKGKILIAI